MPLNTVINYMQPHQPWQSWSPAQPSWLPWPAWDRCPLPLEELDANKNQTKTPITATKNPHQPRQKPINYWCSWYALGENISEEKILIQAKLAKQIKLPIDTVIIDDGWTKWGDWRAADQEKFGTGIAVTAKKIKRLGLQTGLWLAPFLAAPDSELLRLHPEFFLRSKHGQLINGFRSFPPLDYCFYRKYLLDFGQKAVQDYILKSLDQMVENWGIKVLKLDFLYAPYFNPHFDTALQASEQVKLLLSYLRRRHPQVYVIACGCPFGDALGLVDAIRVSKDSSAPPPFPAWIRKRLYRLSMLELEKKSKMPKLWQGAAPDPDVQLFEFDNQKTRQIFNQLNDSYLKGFGDDLTKITPRILQD